MDHMRKFNIKTLGCKVNQCESDAMAREIKNSMALSPGSGDEGDVIVINTCTVTQKASMQSRQAIRKAIRENPDAKVLVTGCYAQTAPHEIAAIKGVHAVIGNREKTRISQFILGDHNTCQPILACGDINGQKRFSSFSRTAFGKRTRPFLKIQDGCDAFCTYCIVPRARGRSRSMPADSVMEQIDRLNKSGFKEVVLTGIHLGCYGIDLAPRSSLTEILSGIRKKGLMGRVRVSSIEPGELGNDIIMLAALPETERGVLCRHFHIPLQSGDNTILERMGRPYDRDYFGTLVHRIKKRLPDAAIGVDILIGFPGETEKAFENTYSLIKVLPVSYLHVFPFSPRKKTPAFSYPDRIPDKIIRSRCKLMRDLGMVKKGAFYQSQVGKTAQVLVETTRDRTTGLLKGFTSNYVSVQFKGGDPYCNTFQMVRIDRLDSTGKPMGTIV